MGEILMKYAALACFSLAIFLVIALFFVAILAPSHSAPPSRIKKEKEKEKEKAKPTPQPKQEKKDDWDEWRREEKDRKEREEKRKRKKEKKKKENDALNQKWRTIETDWTKL
jgi:Ni/Co efflux regulator RcnB